MKKVAIIADGWKKYINYAWIGGCRQYIREHNLDVDLYVFHSFGNYSMDEKYNAGEYNIIELPDFAQFDGIILELTNVSNDKIKEEIIQKACRSGVPTVSLLEEFEGCYFAGTDNYGAMKTLLEHLIDVHGCREINFIGGPHENSENQIRFRAYCDVLQEHGIPYEKERTFFDNFEIETGIEGFDYFRENGRLPRAFVCANDNIAVGLCHRAQEFGYIVPDDFLVTGFDNFDKASYYRPRITTVGCIREDIAYRAMRLLEEIWAGNTEMRGVYTDANCVFQDSCGCVAEHPRSRGQYIVDRIFAEDGENRMQNAVLSLKRELINCENFDEMADCIPKHLMSMQYDELYILLNEEIVECEEISGPEPDGGDDFVSEGYRTKGYPDNMKVLIASAGGKILDNPQLAPGQLIPGKAEGQGGDLYVFSPLHFRDREVGYVAMKNCDYLMDSQMLFEVLNAFQETMENMYHRIILSKMNQELSLLYICDSLTGLYNRMAYSRLAIPLFEKCRKKKIPLLILFVDLDRLKYINDTFGHDMGNLAIKAIAGTLQKCCPGDAIAMRYGGDEFVVLIPNFDEKKTQALIKKIETQIKKQKAFLNTGFPIEASIGYVLTSEENTMNLNDYINLADERMYTIKKQKKVERR